ncbi:MAG: Crp/Fnr family transcriptional regulator [Bacteroidota bacterium]
MTEPLIDFLKLFRNISKEDAATITAACKHRTVAEGEVLLEQGKMAREFFFIIKGVLRIVSANDKGVPVIYFFLKENQFCTILKSFSSSTIPANEGIEAACDAELLSITKEKLYQLYKQISYLKELIDSITQQSLLDKMELRNSYLGEDASTRYRNFSLRQPDIALRVSLSDVASYLCITQQSLSRIRKNTR